MNRTSLQAMASFDAVLPMRLKIKILGGFCGSCRSAVRVRKNGRTYKHRLINGATCQGSGEEPIKYKVLCPLCKKYKQALPTGSPGEFLLAAHTSYSKPCPEQTMIVVAEEGVMEVT